MGAIGLLAAAKFRRLLAQQECFVFPLLTVSAQFLYHWKMLGAPAADGLAPLPKDGGGQFLKPHHGQKFLFDRQSRQFMAAALLNVVATMESPASHHGTERPEAKNSEVLFPASLPKNSAGTKQMSRVARTMTQSMICKCIPEFF